jgi:hypothetical protein
MTSAVVYCNLPTNEAVMTGLVPVSHFTDYMSHASKNKYEKVTQEFQVTIMESSGEYQESVTKR